MLHLKIYIFIVDRRQWQLDSGVRTLHVEGTHTLKRMCIQQRLFIVGSCMAQLFVIVVHKIGKGFYTPV